jgi:hypothetical protein
MKGFLGLSNTKSIKSKQNKAAEVKGYGYKSYTSRGGLVHQVQVFFVVSCFVYLNMAQSVVTVICCI